MSEKYSGHKIRSAGTVNLTATHLDRLNLMIYTPFHFNIKMEFGSDEIEFLKTQIPGNHNPGREAVRELVQKIRPSDNKNIGQKAPKGWQASLAC